MTFHAFVQDFLTKQKTGFRTYLELCRNINRTPTLKQIIQTEIFLINKKATDYNGEK